MNELARFCMDEETAEDLLVIDFTEEQLSISDVQELLHECMVPCVLLQRVPGLLHWTQLGEAKGWQVRIELSSNQDDTWDVCFLREE